MSAADDEVILQACPACGGELNVAGLEPLATVQCPLCEKEFRVPRAFGPYEIVEKLGEGGMGAVYRATDRELQRPVALKLLQREVSDDPAFVEKLEREARLAAAVNHPHVVRVYSFGRDAGQAYLAMELVAGGSLDELMQLQGRVAEAQALEVGIQAADGLRAALAAGLIHRDVKPGNLLFADARTTKVSDFGLAKAMGTDEPGESEIWGTPYYIAPEKLDRRPEDFRSDLYSLGGTLFHAIAGRPPFEAENASLVALKHLKARNVSLQAFAPDVSSETAYVINRMLAKEPDDRYASYDELIAHLRYAADELRKRAGRLAAPRERATMESAQTKQAGGWITLVLLALIVLGAAGAWIFRDRIFTSKDNPTSPLATSAQSTAGDLADPTAQRETLDEIRRLLLDGQTATARAQLQRLLARPELPRPFADWLKLHWLLVLLLEGQPGEARDYAAPMSREKLFTEDPAQRRLANLFPETARLLAQNGPTPLAVAQNFSGASADDFALFLLGLKDWQLAAFDDARGLLITFLKSDPVPPHAWIKEFKPLAERYVAFYETAKPLLARLRQPPADPAERRALAEEARALAAKFPAGDPLRGALLRAIPSP